MGTWLDKPGLNSLEGGLCAAGGGGRGGGEVQGAAIRKGGGLQTRKARQCSGSKGGCQCLAKIHVTRSDTLGGSMGVVQRVVGRKMASRDSKKNITASGCHCLTDTNQNYLISREAASACNRAA